jgi:hypothetical protein
MKIGSSFSEKDMKGMETSWANIVRKTVIIRAIFGTVADVVVNVALLWDVTP